MRRRRGGDGDGGEGGGDPPLTLEFWHNKAQPEGQDVTTIVTRYNAQSAPTAVTEIFQGNGATLLTKLKAALAAATPPDVTYGFGAWMPSFAEQGALVPADDQIKRLGGIKKEDLFPALVSAQTWKGKLQALPYGTGSKGYYVRPEIIKRENVARLPVTWEEFDAFASRVTRDEQYALGMSANDASWFQLLLGQRGGKVLEAPNGRAAFHQQPGIEALTQLTDMAQRKRTLKITSTAAGDFASGQLASLMSGEWQFASTARTARRTTRGSSPARKRPIRRRRCWASTGSTCSRRIPTGRTPPGASPPGCSSRTSTRAGRWPGRSACR